jgi:hypothetical protein
MAKEDSTRNYIGPAGYKAEGEYIFGITLGDNRKSASLAERLQTKAQDAATLEGLDYLVVSIKVPHDTERYKAAKGDDNIREYEIFDSFGFPVTFHVIHSDNKLTVVFPFSGELIPIASSTDSPFQRISTHNQWIPTSTIEAIAERNRSRGIELPPELLPPTDNYPVHTGQEWTEIMQGQTDGKTSTYWTNDEQAQAIVHQRPKAPYYTRIELLQEEKDADKGLDILTGLNTRQSIDTSFATMYIAALLAPPSPTPRGAYTGGWVDLLDVARKIGLPTKHKAEQDQSLRTVYDAILWVSRAQLHGQRTGTYKDPTNPKKIIPTRLSGTPWVIMNEEKPVQPKLFAQMTVPLRVELVMSTEFVHLTTEAITAQYLPFGEILGAIPPSKAVGAWARSIGIAYLNWCRRHPKAAKEGTLLPTRVELLSMFPAKMALYNEVLEGPNPIKAIKYWQGALRELVSREILDDSGEAKEPKPKPEGNKWQTAWKNERVCLLPGSKLKEMLKDRTDALPASKPRNLTVPKRKKKK